MVNFDFPTTLLVQCVPTHTLYLYRLMPAITRHYYPRATDFATCHFAQLSRTLDTVITSLCCVWLYAFTTWFQFPHLTFPLFCHLFFYWTGLYPAQPPLLVLRLTPAFTCGARLCYLVGFLVRFIPCACPHLTCLLPPYLPFTRRLLFPHLAAIPSYCCVTTRCPLWFLVDSAVLYPRCCPARCGRHTCVIAVCSPSTGRFADCRFPLCRGFYCLAVYRCPTTAHIGLVRLVNATTYRTPFPTTATCYPLHAVLLPRAVTTLYLPYRIRLWIGFTTADSYVGSDGFYSTGWRQLTRCIWFAFFPLYAYTMPPTCNICLPLPCCGLPPLWYCHCLSNTPRLT